MSTPYPNVEDEVARLRDEGYVVKSHTDDEITLVRTNGWLSHWLGVIVGGLFGGGISPSPRTQRIYLYVDESGGAQPRLVPRAKDPPDRLP